MLLNTSKRQKVFFEGELDLKMIFALPNFMRSKLKFIMHITIKRLSAPRKDDHLIVLAEKDQQIPNELFSKEELAFIKLERKAERKLVVINQYRRMIFIQILDADKPKPQSLENARKAGSALTARVQALKCDNVTISCQLTSDLALAFAEGMALTSYQFLRYRTNAKKEENSLKSISIQSATLKDRDIELLQIVVDATCQTRDLVNEPLSFLTATELGKQFIRMGRESGFKVQVLNKLAIKKLKMGGLLAVNLGSIDPPTFTVMEWKPKNPVNKKPIILVGKGVVYDTGGMSLKPTPNSMDYMKCDMAGGAAVAGAMYAVAKAKLPVHVVALVPATDNRVDGNAYVPGDVITMMSGKTVEVLNTDAEGRLILADALHFAKRYHPELVMDFATLTGAASTAIGHYGIVAMGKADDKVRDDLREAGNMAYERLAEFPFWDEYDELLKSDIADLKNIGGPTAGAITAGRLLLQFTDYPYMHFDIAGPGFNKGSDSYRGKNGTGVGVRFLFEYLKNRAKK